MRRKLPGFRSVDPLDLGEALSTAAWFPAEHWAGVVTDRALRTLEALWQRGAFEESDAARLAFREFGTTIGVQVRRPAPWIGSRLRCTFDLNPNCAVVRNAATGEPDSCGGVAPQSAAAARALVRRQAVRA